MTSIDTTALDAHLADLDAADAEVRAALAATDTKAQAALDELDALEAPAIPEVTQAELDAVMTAAKDADAGLQKQLADLTTKVASIVTVGGNPDNDILLDSYTGTDDERLTKALDVARTSSPRRPIRLSARAHTFRQTRTTFSGLRILGPNVGWQNPEIGGTNGALPQCVVNLEIPNNGFWLVGTATTYNVTVAGISFKSASASCFYHHPYSAGTSYATTLDTLSFYGFKYVLGKPGDAFSMTLVTLKGSWTCVAVQDTQFSLRGSDNFLWVAGDLNYGWQGANGGRYLMRFENLSKTAVKHLYLTARGGSRAILVEPTTQGGLDISDCVVEGQNANDPAMGALIVTKGHVSLTNIKLNFGMARPADFTDQKDTGLIMVLAGVALITNVWTLRANVPGSSTPVAEAVPVVDVIGGAAYVSRVIGLGLSSQPLVRKATAGTTVIDASVRAA